MCIRDSGIGDHAAFYFNRGNEFSEIDKVALTHVIASSMTTARQRFGDDSASAESFAAEYLYQILSKKAFYDKSPALRENRYRGSCRDDETPVLLGPRYNAHGRDLDMCALNRIDYKSHAGASSYEVSSYVYLEIVGYLEAIKTAEGKSIRYVLDPKSEKFKPSYILEVID